MLEQKLNNGEFVITAEIVPPLSGAVDDLISRVAPLKGLVDGVNLTDGAGARLAMSSLSASALLVREGFEPILQMTCRDRNRIGLASDLLGASALGIKNVLVLRGDDPSKGDMPKAKPVFDLESADLIKMAANLQYFIDEEGIDEEGLDEGGLDEGGRANKGRKILSLPEMHVGCADAPHDPAPDWKPEGLRAKIAAGARFAQTQFCFDVEIAERYFSHLSDEGITDKLKFIVGVGPLLSARQAHFMNDNLFGVHVPEHIISRMEEADDQKAEGREICAEIVQGLRDVTGVGGVHIMAPMQNGQAIAQTIEAIGDVTRAS